MSKCVLIIGILKSQCKYISLWGSAYSKKKVCWEVIFSELGFTGSGARKLRRELKLEGSTLKFKVTFFAACSELEASGGFNCVSKVRLKSQCKKYGICKGKIKPHLGKVYSFYQHCFTKIIEF